MEKKFSSLFAILLLSVFLILSANSSYADIIYMGTVVTGDLPYVGTDISNSALGSNATEEAVEVNNLINAWNNIPNNQSSTSYPLPFVSSYVENTDLWTWDGDTSINNSGEIEYDTTGTITWTGSWTYLTVKYGTTFDLYYIGDDSVNYINWVSSTDNALSHVRLWDASPVPEPATMLLLGSGLVGLAGFRRKFKK